MDFVHHGNMTSNTVVIVGLIYIFALLISGFLGFPFPDFSFSILVLPTLIFTSLALISAFVIPHFWRTGPKFIFWLTIPIVAIFACLYLQFRFPQPHLNDISKFVPQVQGELATVTGKIVNNPSLNSKNNVRFLLSVNQLKNLDKNVSGKLYITVPILQGTGLSPGQNLTVTGILYQPQSNLNPAGFDFKKYLARQGVFAGLKGIKIDEYGIKKLGWWQLRKRIVKAQVRWLYSPNGPLVSSLVLGRKAVDLPIDIRNSFIQVGLAHVLAASGFHVALLLGVLLNLIDSFSNKNKLIISGFILVFYIILTGGQPSILRASIMGFGAVIGIVTERKLRRFSFLILTASALLLINPLWISDLSFQLSFLATLGLMVTAPAILNKLDFLPPTIANLIAIPLAANIWVLPVLIYIFNSVSLYSILINIVATPLIAIISLVGMLSAFSALIFPILGSAIALILYYPTNILITIVEFFNNLPGSYLAIGQISLSQLIIIYILYIAISLHSWFAKKWWLFSIFILSLVVIPILYNNLTLTQVTILAANQDPIVIIQNQGKVALINTEDKSNETYIIKPFLAQQGINNLDLQINLTEINQREYNLSKNINISIFDNYIQLAISHNKWWIFDKNLINITNLPISQNTIPDVILWTGNPKLEWWKMANPKIAIALTNYLNESVKKELEKNNIKLFITGRDGAIQWTEKNGFNTKFEIINEEV